MSPDSLSRMLSSLLEEQSVKVLSRLTENGEYVLMDSTVIFSKSESISFLENGYNSRGMHLQQINIMMLFLSTNSMPTFVRIIPGSIKDVSAISKPLTWGNR